MKRRVPQFEALARSLGRADLLSSRPSPTSPHVPARGVAAGAGAHARPRLPNATGPHDSHHVRSGRQPPVGGGPVTRPATCRGGRLPACAAAVIGVLLPAPAPGLLHLAFVPRAVWTEPGGGPGDPLCRSAPPPSARRPVRTACTTASAAPDRSVGTTQRGSGAGMRTSALTRCASSASARARRSLRAMSITSWRCEQAVRASIRPTCNRSVARVTIARRQASAYVATRAARSPRVALQCSRQRGGTCERTGRDTGQGGRVMFAMVARAYRRAGAHIFSRV
jgi:hypothetical protein